MSRIITRNWLGPFLFCVLGLMIPACAPVEATLPAATVNAQVPLSTARVTNTAELPSPTTTPLPINTDDLSILKITPSPTNTITPEATPTLGSSREPFPSPTPLFPTPFSLPAWVSDSESAVLLDTVRGQYDGYGGPVYLLDASTGEKLEITTTDDPWSTEWHQTNTGLTLRVYKTVSDSQNPDDFYFHQINIFTGEEILLSVSEIYNRDRSLSPDGQFTTRISSILDEKQVVIINQESGEEITLTDPFDGRYPDGPALSWSSDSLLIAARYGDYDEVESTIGLAIYDTDGRVQQSYIDVWNWAWAPDSSHRILTLDVDFSESRQPCILDIDIYVMDCLNEVAEWRENGIERTGYYEWLPDGSGISFLYWNETGERKTGLCIFQIASREITCPINETHLTSANLDAEIGAFTFLVGYLWSPDGRYVAVEIDRCPGCDDRTSTQVATIARDGSQFHLWGFGLLWDAKWRPPLETTN